MVELIENGMIVGAERVWEEKNKEGPYERALFADMESYLFDRERVHEVVEHICGLEDGDITEEVAVLIYDHIISNETDKAVRWWFEKWVEPDKYDAWWKDRNDYVE